jgi:ferredoxin-NADP reductase
VILRASTPEELYLLDEVVALCEAKGATLTLLVGPRAGQTWVPVTDAGATLTDFVPWATEADVYVCGPNPWMDAVLADVAACGIPAAQVHDEKFDW